jgi:hypothetical protein
MDPEYLQTVAARDQLWASLRPLLPELKKLADGELDGSPRQLQIIVLMAKILSAELEFRAEEGKT